MNINILSKLRSSKELPFLVVDFLMMMLILTNLSWILFDTLFTSELIRFALSQPFPRFIEYYGDQIHPNFILYDLYFVAIFVTELLIRWFVAIWRQDYHRWWFFPFIHWYDVLGCIPVGSFRWLRLLRVVSIVYRLERHNIIDLSGAPPVRFLRKYGNVLVEELTNRVVVNVLDSVQSEIQNSTPVVSKIIERVVQPRSDELMEWLVPQIRELSGSAFERKRDTIEAYVECIVVDTFAKNVGIAELQKVPVIGEAIAQIVEDGVSQLIFDMVEHIATDISSLDTDLLIDHLTKTLSEKMNRPPGKVRIESREMILEALDVIKEEAMIQKWKLAEEKAGQNAQASLVPRL